jgi:hypothetical protein
MRTRLKFALLATVLLALAVYHSRLSRACSPQAFMPYPIFINTLHPDLPIGPFDKGRLGVIQPTYSSIYLLVAYRNLEGRPVSPAEQDALWNGDTILLTGAAHPLAAQAPQQNLSAASQGNQDWESAWFAVMGQIERGLPVPQRFLMPGSQPGSGIYRQNVVNSSGGTYYNQFLNCQDDAFREAVSTYKRLSGQFGGSSPVVQDWIKAQQMVFGNCIAGEDVPSPLPASAPAIAREARAYQIAAAHFYIGDFDQAAAEFRAIGQDMSSPWSTIGPYLVARTLVRKASIGGPSSAGPSALAQAEAELNAALSDPRYSRYHHAAEQLRGLIEYRLHPRQRLAELANNLTRVSGDDNMAQDAIDFRLLFPKVTQRYSYRVPPPIGSKLYAELADVRAKSDLLDWMFTLRADGPEAYTHSLEKWESTHCKAWLVAALTKASPGSPQLSEVLAAARRLPQGSPAYDSATFQRLRLMLLQGHRTAAREQLARLGISRAESVAKDYKDQPSTANLFLALHFELARNLEQLFEYAPRVPATITNDDSRDEMPVDIWEPNDNSFDPNAARLDDDGVMIFNRYLPVAMLAKAVRRTKIPEDLRREIALAAWTRAALLGDPAVARSLSTAVETFEPKLKTSIQAYNRAATPAARHFAAVLAVLEFPGLRPFITTLDRETPVGELDDYRDNWWGTEGPQCTSPFLYSQKGQPGYQPLPQWPQIGRALQTIYPSGKVNPPAFLTAREQTEAANEWQRLLKMSPAPDYLAAEAVAWGRAHPSDRRVPEALALAVKSTRFGCADPATGKFSKAAFELLHSRYPKSTWTEKTKYWFKM